MLNHRFKISQNTLFLYLFVSRMQEILDHHTVTTRIYFTAVIMYNIHVFIICKIPVNAMAL